MEMGGKMMFGLLLYAGTFLFLIDILKWGSKFSEVLLKKEPHKRKVFYYYIDFFSSANLAAVHSLYPS